MRQKEGGRPGQQDGEKGRRRDRLGWRGGLMMERLDGTCGQHE